MAENLAQRKPIGFVTVAKVTHNSGDTTTIVGVDEAGQVWECTMPNGATVRRIVNDPRRN